MKKTQGNVKAVKLTLNKRSLRQLDRTNLAAIKGEGMPASFYYSCDPFYCWTDQCR